MSTPRPYISITTHINPSRFFPAVSADWKELIGRRVFRELCRTECHVALTFVGRVAREFGGQIKRDMLTGSITVEDVDLDLDDSGLVCCDFLAQYVAEAAHDVWVAEGNPDDWFHASIEYIESEDAPSFMISGFTLTFKKKGFSEDEKPD